MVASLEEVCALIMERAKPYLQTRSNEIHTPIAFNMAKRLLEYYPDANGDVVLPAIILHDVGWIMIPEDKQLNAFGPRMTDTDLRRVHEKEGARIAAEILASLGVDSAIIERVVAIIDGHDSRSEPFSIDDAVVMDADKLWRFTEVGVDIDHRRFGYEIGDYLVYLHEQIDRWLHTPAARQIALQCLLDISTAKSKAGSVVGDWGSKFS